MSEWGRWFRENFDKLLLTVVFLTCIGLVVHMAHHSADSDEILWARELAQTFAGGLLGLITGHALAVKATKPTPETEAKGNGKSTE